MRPKRFNERTVHRNEFHRREALLHCKHQHIEPALDVTGYRKQLGNVKRQVRVEAREIHSSERGERPGMITSQRRDQRIRLRHVWNIRMSLEHPVYVLLRLIQFAVDASEVPKVPVREEVRGIGDDCALEWRDRRMIVATLRNHLMDCAMSPRSICR